MRGGSHKVGLSGVTLFGMGRCVTSGVRVLGFRGGNSFALALRVGSDRCVRTCCCRWLLEVGAVAIGCWAVGGRVMPTRLVLRAWHWFEKHLMLFTNQLAH